MPPTLIPAPSFSPLREDPDFEADFDLPDDDAVIAPSVPTVTLERGNEDGEDWDKEFAPGSAATTPVRGAVSARGTVTNLAAKLRVPTTRTTEDWDDDEDFDLPPLSSKPMKLSFSPRTKLRMDNPDADELGGADSLNRNPASDTQDEEDGNASTIKVSKLAFSAALAASNPSFPAATARMSSSPPTSTPLDDDLEDDLIIPDELSHLSLKPLGLGHRTSKASLDSWGDNTGTTLFSDASSGTLSQPSSCQSASQPSTEDESDDFMDEEGEFEGLVLPDSLSSKDMRKILEDKKAGLFGAKDNIRVARPSDGEDDFEMGLVIGGDDDLSPSRLKEQMAVNRRAVGRGAVRSLSEPQRPAINHPAPSMGTIRPPSRLREEIPVSGRETANSPPIPSSIRSSRVPTESFPALRRAPSSILPSSRPPPSRWQTLSTTIRPQPSLNLIHHTRSPSPTRPLPSASSPSPYPKSPSPVSSLTSVPPSVSPTVLEPTSSKPSFIKHQKSHSKLPSGTVGNGVRKLSRKASLSSLVDTPSQHLPSPSPSPEVPFPHSSKPLSHKPSLRRVPTGLSHAASYRDLGVAATIGHSAGGSQADRKKYAYEAPTVASRVRRAEKLGITSGTVSDGGAMSGSDREREKPSMPSSSSSRSITRSRPAISNIFPTVALPSNLNPARSPSPTTPHTRVMSLSRKPSNLTAPTKSSAQRVVTQPPAVKILRRPKKSRIFGDGTELDGIEDLKVEREKESKYRVTPSARGNVTQPRVRATSVAGPVMGLGPTGTISRKRGVESANATLNAGPRPTSSASSQGTPAEALKPMPTLRRQQRVDFPRVEPNVTPAMKKKKDGTSPLNNSTRKKPTLIRNLGGAGSPKVVGDMKWNPKTLKWEGNDAVLRDFEVSSSSRPALITHLTGSSVGALSPSGSFSSLTSGARVVGEMMFDPIKMCWISRTGEEDDAFAGFDDDADDEGWDADGKGGTIRGVLTTSSGAPSVGSTLRRESGVSSEESSPARSTRGSHARSASESDSESITGSFTGRESSLSTAVSGGMLTISENGDAIVPVPKDLVAASAVAEDRHKSEMRGWHIPTTHAVRRRVGARGLPEPQDSEEINRSYLWDIRALATRSF
ncbi:hypothetical protein FRB99_002474 [Tulasnella sp. 403]|nr:hypothetical protein FRB99_002474 [Tulasnella sp. 403]